MQAQTIIILAQEIIKEFHFHQNSGMQVFLERNDEAVLVHRASPRGNKLFGGMFRRRSEAVVLISFLCIEMYVISTVDKKTQNNKNA